MKKIVSRLIVLVSSLFMLPHFLYGQQAAAPIYRDGDWWRVKVAVKWVKSPPRDTPSPCFLVYPEYLVKMDAGAPKVFGVKPLLEKEQLEAIDCPAIVSNLLGKSKENFQFPLRLDLQFPMAVGSTWRSSVAPVMYRVQSWEKIETPKGEFDAFKIGRLDLPGWKLGRPTSYYYSPEVKAIVYSEENAEEPGYVLTYTLVNFNVGQ